MEVLHEGALTNVKLDCGNTVIIDKQDDLVFLSIFYKGGHSYVSLTPMEIEQIIQGLFLAVGIE
jgi:hypothetical protein